MNKLYKNYIPQKRKEIIFIAIPFIIIALNFLNFTGLVSTGFLSSNIYKNYFGILIKLIGFIGIIISINYLGKNISPFPTSLKNRTLVNSGLYKWISHPMYYSAILFSIEILVRYLTILNLFLTIFLIIFFKFIIKIEEEYLEKKYKAIKFIKEV